MPWGMVTNEHEEAALLAANNHMVCVTNKKLADMGLLHLFTVAPSGMVAIHALLHYLHRRRVPASHPDFKDQEMLFDYALHVLAFSKGIMSMPWSLPADGAYYILTCPDGSEITNPDLRLLVEKMGALGLIPEGAGLDSSVLKYHCENCEETHSLSPMSYQTLAWEAFRYDMYRRLNSPDSYKHVMEQGHKQRASYLANFAGGNPTQDLSTN